MPRFVLHQSKSSAAAVGEGVPDGLRSDVRVKIIEEMPRLILLEGDASVVEEWLTRMPGWTLQPETRVKMPDPRPKLRRP